MFLNKFETNPKKSWTVNTEENKARSWNETMTVDMEMPVSGYLLSKHKKHIDVLATTQ